MIQHLHGHAPALAVTGANELHLTHEFMASMLGVRRPGVSEVAAHLKEAQIIDYTRGDIHILDRRRLEGPACECYATVKEEFDRLYTQPPL